MACCSTVKQFPPYKNSSLWYGGLASHSATRYLMMTSCSRAVTLCDKARKFWPAPSTARLQGAQKPGVNGVLRGKPRSSHWATPTAADTAWLAPASGRAAGAAQ